MTSSTSSDEEGYVHKFQVVPPEDGSDGSGPSPTQFDHRTESPAVSDEGSAGYATDDTALSSLGPLDIKRVSVDYSESQGYISNAELSPIPRIEVTTPDAVPPAHHSPRGTVPADLTSGRTTPRMSPLEVTVPAHQTSRGTVPAHHSPTVPEPLTPRSDRRGTVASIQYSPRGTVPPAHQTLRDTVAKDRQVTVPANLNSRTTVPAHQTLNHKTSRTAPLEVTVHQTPRITVPTHPGILEVKTSPNGVTVPTPKTTVPAHQTSKGAVPADLTPRITVPKITVTDPTEPLRQPLYTKKPSQEYPRIDIRNRGPSLKKLDPIYKSSQNIPQKKENLERSATLSNLTDEPEEDPIDRFMRSHIYKTKMITTVFEAKDRGFEEISLDVIHEIDRWFESKNMMAVACELHWSVPREKRSRQLECKLKEKLLNALRENNKRLLYLRGMGHGKTPVKLAESNTVENISRDRETDSVRGIYQRSYTRLLPYLHKETPEWHSQYWTLQDLQQISNDDVIVEPNPQKFLFESEPTDVLARDSLISLNIIGLSILGNSRKSCGSLFLGGQA